MIKKISLLLVGLFCASWCMSQIVDDSTRLVYGPTSTRYILMEDLKHNDTLYHVMDTAIHNLEEFELHRRSEIDYQDLGNHGTALKPIYYQLPETVGRTTGFSSFDPYVKTPEEFKYYDSKSPYINMDVVLGGKGRSMVDFEFSRNVNPQWNVGFDVRYISSEKQIGVTFGNENQVNSVGVDAYTFYKSKNQRYHMMFHIYRNDQTILETGGITKDTEPIDYYEYENANIYLRNSQSFDQRTRVFLYHDFSVKPYFELYNKIERSAVTNKYTDTPLTYSSTSTDTYTSDLYYDEILINSDSTLDASRLDETKIEAGIKGRVADRVFYSAYVKRRDLDYRYRYSNPYDHVSENYLGGDIKMYILGDNVLEGEAEIMDAGNYYFKGSFRTKFLKAGYTSSFYQPSFLSENYLGNHYEWRNSFNSTLANRIQGSIYYDFPFLYVEPEVEIVTLDEYIYFGYDNEPLQERDPILINKYSVKANFTFIENLHLDNRLIWNNVAGTGGSQNAMRIPTWNYFGKLYYADIVFNDFMQFECGFNLRWQSAFYAKEYDPVTQQFFLQDSFRLPSYFTADFFFVMKANDLSFFFKWEYLNQARDEGYFASPYYPGQRRAIDLGIRWMFFD